MNQQDKGDKDYSISRNWYVVFTKHNCEKKLQKTLENNGITAYVPFYTTIRQWSDRKKKVIVPLINSVVFVQMDKNQLNDLYIYPHVKGILKEFGSPAVVYDQEIKNLEIIAKEWNGETVSAGDKSSNLNKGDSVEVLRGPFAGIFGELLVINGKHRVVVRLNSMNVEFVVNVPLNAVKKSS
ncbi:MAG: UpxY family transcription antiterminator [Brumimicrobium sp.]